MASRLIVVMSTVALMQKIVPTTTAVPLRLVVLTTAALIRNIAVLSKMAILLTVTVGRACHGRYSFLLPLSRPPVPVGLRLVLPQGCTADSQRQVFHLAGSHCG